jgi:glyoxylase-like metal-dependent hydrolase (beta-lactamase superfamily II)
MSDPNRRDAMVLAAGGAALFAAPNAATAQTPATAGQAPGFYRWRIGDIVATAINDGFSTRPSLDGMVRNVPVDDVRRALEAAFLPTNPSTSPFTTLVVQTGGRTVLLDTGFANNGPPTTGTWMTNFRAAGFDPMRVDQILITHFHGDHIGGIRMRDGQLVFPNAEISVPQPEWDFWMSEERMNAAPETGRAGFMNARRVFAPIAAHVRRYTPGQELAPGITSMAAFGHTPGHCVFTIASGGARLMFMGDAVTTPALFVRNPDWSPFFDMNEEAGRATRRRLLEMAASERLQLHIYHAPFPATGFAAREGNGFHWVPVAWNSAV